jgi:hypothetical protein
MRYLLFVIASLFVLVFPQVGSAQDEATPSAEPVQETIETISYTLPYPGILPDNPLYSIKMIRDRIVLFLISDKIKRSQFNLLQADKRLQAGVYLFQKDANKTSLALSTISKGQNYFVDAINDATDVQKEKKEVGSLINELQTATRKHREVLLVLRENVSGEHKQTVDLLLQQVESLNKKAETLAQ